MKATRVYDVTAKMDDDWFDGRMRVLLAGEDPEGDVILAQAPTAAGARKAAIRKLKTIIRQLERMDA
jgi:hypothetical protein